VPEVSSLSVERAIEFFRIAHAPRVARRIAVKVVKEIGDASAS